MGMRDEVLKLAEECGGYIADDLPTDWDSGDIILSPAELERFYRAASRQAAERMKVKAVKAADLSSTYLSTREVYVKKLALDAIRAIDLNELFK